MGVRRVVTGHTPDGRAVFVSDEEVDPIPIGERGSSAALLWGRRDPARFPDDGSRPPAPDAFPPPGGCVVAVWEITPDGGDDFHEFVRTGLAPWADPDEPGMHRTATLDYDVVLAGTVGLELDDGAEVLLGPGDVIVQNGTRHRWHNRGDTVARVMAVAIGAHHELSGGAPAG